MTFLTLQERAAKKLKLLTSADAFLTGKDLTQDDIQESINDAYLEIAVPALMQQHPEFFEVEALSPNYSVTGVADASSTGSTLVATSSIFTLGMIGQYVYNSTDSVSRKITGYTSGTTVTLLSAIDDDWDGDSIQVINKAFTLEGDATDAYGVKYVKVRYSPTQSYVRATGGFENRVIQAGDETFSMRSPFYFITSVKSSTSGLKTSAVEILPYMTIPDDTAVYLKYLEMPAAMSANGDVPRLPIGHHEFLYWKAVMDGAVIRKENDLYSLAKTEFYEGLNKMVTAYQPQTYDSSIKSSLPRRLTLMADHRI